MSNCRHTRLQLKVILSLQFQIISMICLTYTKITFTDLRPAGPKRTMRRLLKKEVSLDTYTWQKKYGHLTSSVMMAQVDERLKRRFSVSASMEEISKIAEMKSLASQTSLGPEQAALAQSQHFDQLEALWNKRSPPRRRHNSVRKKFICFLFYETWSSFLIRFLFFFPPYSHFPDNHL